jgi:hypothetical protein
MFQRSSTTSRNASTFALRFPHTTLDTTPLNNTCRLYRVLKKKPSGLRDMITYIKTKKKVPVDTWPEMLGFPYISTYVFFTCAIISHEPLNV